MANSSRKHNHQSETVSGMKKDMESIGKKFDNLKRVAKAKSTESANEVIKKAKQHPVKALGIACGVGLILGWLIKR